MFGNLFLIVYGGEHFGADDVDFDFPVFELDPELESELHPYPDSEQYPVYDAE